MKLKRTKIKKIRLKANEDVYDLTINNQHNFFANNLLVHNLFTNFFRLCCTKLARLLTDKLFIQHQLVFLYKKKHGEYNYNYQ